MEKVRRVHRLPVWWLLAAIGLQSGCDGSSSQDSEPDVLAALAGETVEFGVERVALSESERSIDISVSRQSSSTSPMRVRYMTVALSAVSGQDYQPLDGELIWSANDSSVKTITIIVESDDIEEELESLELRLFRSDAGIETEADYASLRIDIQDADCDGDVDIALLTMQFDAPCYLLDESWSVGSGSELRLSAGVTLIADAGISIVVTGNATFQSNGRLQKPVTIKGRDSMVGFWSGLSFANSESTSNELVHTTIRDADVAVQVDEYSQLTRFNNNILEFNRLPVSVPVGSVGIIDDSSTIVSNALDRIVIHGNQLHDNVTWGATKVPYLSQESMNVYGRLQLSAGVQWRFVEGASLNVMKFGVLRAVGSDDHPVQLMGELPEAGSWAGIRFFNTLNVDNWLENTTIGGAGGEIEYPGAIALIGDDFGLTLRDVLIKNSAAHGLWIDQSQTGVLPPGIELSTLEFLDLAGQDVFVE